MEFKDIFDDLRKVLKKGNGRYLTAYHVWLRLRPKLKEQLSVEYGSNVGKEAGKHYTPANFIARALDNLSKSDDRVKKNWIDSIGLTIESIEPGYRGGWLSIWAWEED